MFDEANKRTACLLLNFVLLKLAAHYCILSKDNAHRYFKISNDIDFRLGSIPIFPLNNIWEKRLTQQFAKFLSQNSLKSSSSPVDPDGISAKIRKEYGPELLKITRLLERGEFESLLKGFEALIRKAFPEAKPYFLAEKGAVLSRLGRYSEAIDLYRQAYEIARAAGISDEGFSLEVKTSVEMNQVLSIYQHYKMEREPLVKVIEKIEQSVQSYPEDIDVLRMAASILAKERVFGRAVTIAQAGLKLNGNASDKAELCLIIGSVHGAGKKLEEAKEAFVAGLEFYQESLRDKHFRFAAKETAEKLYTNLGEIYQEQDKPEEAIAAWEKAVRLSGGNNRLTEKIALACINFAHYQKAREYIQNIFSNHFDEVQELLSQVDTEEGYRLIFQEGFSGAEENKRKRFAEKILQAELKEQGKAVIALREIIEEGLVSAAKKMKGKLKPRHTRMLEEAVPVLMVLEGQFCVNPYQVPPEIKRRIPELMELEERSGKILQWFRKAYADFLSAPDEQAQFEFCIKKSLANRNNIIILLNSIDTLVDIIDREVCVVTDEPYIEKIDFVYSKGDPDCLARVYEDAQAGRYFLSYEFNLACEPGFLDEEETKRAGEYLSQRKRAYQEVFRYNQVFNKKLIAALADKRSARGPIADIKKKIGFLQSEVAGITVGPTGKLELKPKEDLFSALNEMAATAAKLNSSSPLLPLEITEVEGLKTRIEEAAAKLDKAGFFTVLEKEFFHIFKIRGNWVICVPASYILVNLLKKILDLSFERNGGFSIGMIFGGVAVNGEKYEIVDHTWLTVYSGNKRIISIDPTYGQFDGEFIGKFLIVDFEESKNAGYLEWDEFLETEFEKYRKRNFGQTPEEIIYNLRKSFREMAEIEPLKFLFPPRLLLLYDEGSKTRRAEENPGVILPIFRENPLFENIDFDAIVERLYSYYCSSSPLEYDYIYRMLARGGFSSSPVEISPMLKPLNITLDDYSIYSKFADNKLQEGGKKIKEGKPKEALSFYLTALEHPLFGYKAMLGKFPLRHKLYPEFEQQILALESCCQEIISSYGPELNRQTPAMSFTYQGRLKALHSELSKFLKKDGRDMDLPLIVVDVGIGSDGAPTTFDLAESLSEAGFKNLRIYGIDNNTAFLKKAEDALARNALASKPNLKIKFRYAQDFDFSGLKELYDREANTGKVDMVIAANVLMYYDSYSRKVAIERMLKVLNEKGILSLSTGPNVVYHEYIDFSICAKDGMYIEGYEQRRLFEGYGRKRLFADNKPSLSLEKILKKVPLDSGNGLLIGAMRNPKGTFVIRERVYDQEDFLHLILKVDTDNFSEELAGWNNFSLKGDKLIVGSNRDKDEIEVKKLRSGGLGSFLIYCMLCKAIENSAKEYFIFSPRTPLFSHFGINQEKVGRKTGYYIYTDSLKPEQIEQALITTRSGERKLNFEFIYKERKSSSPVVGPHRGQAVPLSKDTIQCSTELILEELRLVPLQSAEERQIYRYNGDFFTRRAWGVIDNGKSRALFIRIGYLFFLDSTAYSRLSPALKEILGPNVILLRKLWLNEIAKFPFSWYNAPVIISMMERRITADKTILDIGAGYGIISLTALKLGSSFVHLVDSYWPALLIANIQLELNGKVRGLDFQFHCGDITQKPFVKEQVGVIRNNIRDSSEEILVVSNIGVWPGVYTATNAHSIGLVKHFPEITHFTGAGYTYTPSLNFKQTRHDYAFIRRLGFEVEPEPVRVGRTELIASWNAKRTSLPLNKIRPGAAALSSKTSGSPVGKIDIFDFAKIAGDIIGRQSIQGVLIGNRSSGKVLLILGLPGIGKSSIARLLVCDKESSYLEENSGLDWVFLGEEILMLIVMSFHGDTKLFCEVSESIRAGVLDAYLSFRLGRDNSKYITDIKSKNGIYALSDILVLGYNEAGIYNQIKILENKLGISFPGKVEIRSQTIKERSLEEYFNIADSIRALSGNPGGSKISGLVYRPLPSSSPVEKGAGAALTYSRKLNFPITDFSKAVFPGIKIFDFGCGHPMYRNVSWEQSLKKRYKGLEYYGVDNDGLCFAEIIVDAAGALLNRLYRARRDLVRNITEYRRQSYLANLPKRWGKADIVTLHSPYVKEDYLMQVENGTVVKAVYDNLKPGGVALILTEWHIYGLNGDLNITPKRVVRKAFMKSLRNIFGRENVRETPIPSGYFQEALVSYKLYKGRNSNNADFGISFLQAQKIQRPEAKNISADRNCASSPIAVSPWPANLVPKLRRVASEYFPYVFNNSTLAEAKDVFNQRSNNFLKELLSLVGGRPLSNLSWDYEYPVRSIRWLELALKDKLNNAFDAAISLCEPDWVEIKGLKVPASYRGRVSLKVFFDGRDLHIIVTDNGPGYGNAADTNWKRNRDIYFGKRGGGIASIRDIARGIIVPHAEIKRGVIRSIKFNLSVVSELKNRLIQSVYMEDRKEGDNLKFNLQETREISEASSGSEKFKFISKELEFSSNDARQVTVTELIIPREFLQPVRMAKELTVKYGIMPKGPVSSSPVEIEQALAVLYGEERLEYFRKIKNAILPGAAVLFYPGFGSDVILPLYLFNPAVILATDELPFSEEGSNGSRWIEEYERYKEEYMYDKLFYGFSKTELLEAIRFLGAPIIWELELLGVKREDINIDAYNNNIARVSFMWHSKDKGDSLYEIRFFGGMDLNDVDRYPDFLKESMEKADSFMQKALWSVKNKSPDMPLPAALNYIVSNLNGPKSTVLSDRRLGLDFDCWEEAYYSDVQFGHYNGVEKGGFIYRRKTPLILSAENIASSPIIRDSKIREAIRIGPLKSSSPLKVLFIDYEGTLVYDLKPRSEAERLYRFQLESGERIFVPFDGAVAFLKELRKRKIEIICVYGLTGAVIYKAIEENLSGLRPVDHVKGESKKKIIEVVLSRRGIPARQAAFIDNLASEIKQAVEIPGLTVLGFSAGNESAAGELIAAGARGIISDYYDNGREALRLLGIISKEPASSPLGGFTNDIVLFPEKGSSPVRNYNKAWQRPMVGRGGSIVEEAFALRVSVQGYAQKLLKILSDNNIPVNGALTYAIPKVEEATKDKPAKWFKMAMQLGIELIRDEGILPCPVLALGVPPAVNSSEGCINGYADNLRRLRSLVMEINESTREEMLRKFAATWERPSGKAAEQVLRKEVYRRITRVLSSSSSPVEAYLAKQLSGYGYNDTLRRKGYVDCHEQKIRVNFYGESYSRKAETYFYRSGRIIVIDNHYLHLFNLARFTEDGVVAIGVDILDMLREGYAYDSRSFQQWTVGCLLAMQELEFKDKIVVDAGSGDGVITFAALALGAKKIYALDMYEGSRKVILKSLGINGFPQEKINFQYLGYLFSELKRKAPFDKKADILVANLTQFGIPGLAGDYDNCLKNDDLADLTDFFRPKTVIISGNGNIGYLKQHLARKKFAYRVERELYFENEFIGGVLREASSSPAVGLMDTAAGRLRILDNYLFERLIREPGLDYKKELLIADVGCGKGAVTSIELSDYAKRAGNSPKVTVIALDSSQEAFENINMLDSEGVIFQEADFRSKYYSGLRVDIVRCINVIRWLNPCDFIENIAALAGPLTEGGILIVGNNDIDDYRILMAFVYQKKNSGLLKRQILFGFVGERLDERFLEVIKGFPQGDKDILSFRKDIPEARSDFKNGYVFSFERGLGQLGYGIVNKDGYRLTVKNFNPPRIGAIPVLNTSSSPARKATTVNQLFNQRQMVALELLCQNEPYKEIGRVLNLSHQGTVKKIVHSVLDAFGLEHNTKKAWPQLVEKAKEFYPGILINPLTDTEKNILTLIQEGRIKSRDIASSRHVTVEANKRHIRGIKNKLGIKGKGFGPAVAEKILKQALEMKLLSHMQNKAVFLSDVQINALSLRAAGLSYGEINTQLGIARSDVLCSPAYIKKRARQQQIKITLKSGSHNTPFATSLILIRALQAQGQLPKELDLSSLQLRAKKEKFGFAKLEILRLLACGKDLNEVMEIQKRSSYGSLWGLLKKSCQALEVDIEISEKADFLPLLQAARREGLIEGYLTMDELIAEMEKKIECLVSIGILKTRGQVLAGLEERAKRRGDIISLARIERYYQNVEPRISMESNSISAGSPLAKNHMASPLYKMQEQAFTGRLSSSPAVQDSALMPMKSFFVNARVWSELPDYFTEIITRSISWAEGDIYPYGIRGRRTAVFPLKRPVECSNGKIIRALEIKGILFKEGDSVSHPLKELYRVFKVPELDAQGQIILRDSTDLKGGLAYRASVNEYRILKELNGRVDNDYAYPVGYGQYRDYRNKDEAFGFFIRGVSQYPGERIWDLLRRRHGSNLYNSISLWRKYSGLLEKYGLALRDFHDAGFFHNYPHLGNISWNRERERIIFHDFETCLSIKDEARERKVSYRLMDLFSAYAHFLNFAFGKHENFQDLFSLDSRLSARQNPFIPFFKGYFNSAEADLHSLSPQVIDGFFSAMIEPVTEIDNEIIRMLLDSEVPGQDTGSSLSSKASSPLNNLLQKTISVLCGDSEVRPELFRFIEEIRRQALVLLFAGSDMRENNALVDYKCREHDNYDSLYSEIKPFIRFISVTPLYSNILCFLACTLENLNWHVRDGLALIVVYFTKDMWIISVNDNGRGFRDKKGRPVRTDEVIKWKKSLGKNGREGKGLTVAAGREADLTVISQPRESSVIAKLPFILHPKCRSVFKIENDRRRGTSITGYFYRGLLTPDKQEWKEETIGRLEADLKQGIYSPIISSSPLKKDPNQQLYRKAIFYLRFRNVAEASRAALELAYKDPKLAYDFYLRFIRLNKPGVLEEVHKGALRLLIAYDVLGNELFKELARVRNRSSSPVKIGRKHIVEICGARLKLIPYGDFANARVEIRTGDGREVGFIYGVGEFCSDGLKRFGLRGMKLEADFRGTNLSLGLIREFMKIFPADWMHRNHNPLLSIIFKEHFGFGPVNPDFRNRVYVGRPDENKIIPLFFPYHQEPQKAIPDNGLNLGFKITSTTPHPYTKTYIMTEYTGCGSLPAGALVRTYSSAASSPLYNKNFELTQTNFTLDKAYSLLRECKFSGDYDLVYSRALLREILNYPIEKIMVVGMGLRYLPLLLAMVGKQVVFVNKDIARLNIVQNDARTINALLKEPRKKLRIEFIQGEIGSLDIKANNLEPESFDLVTFVDLIGGIPQGNPRDWLLKAKVLLKPEGYLVIDEDKAREGQSSLIDYFSDIFPEYEQLAGGAYLKGAWNGERSKNRFLKIKSSIGAPKRLFEAGSSSPVFSLSSVILSELKYWMDNYPPLIKNKKATKYNEWEPTCDEPSGLIEPLPVLKRRPLNYAGNGDKGEKPNWKTLEVKNYFTVQFPSRKAQGIIYREIKLGNKAALRMFIDIGLARIAALAVSFIKSLPRKIIQDEDCYAGALDIIQHPLIYRYVRDLAVAFNYFPDNGTFEGFIEEYWKNFWRKEMACELNNGIIPVPHNFYQRRHKVVEAARVLEESGLWASYERISQVSGMDLDSVHAMIGGCPLDGNIVSFETPISDNREESFTLEDTIGFEPNSWTGKLTVLINYLTERMKKCRVGWQQQIVFIYYQILKYGWAETNEELAKRGFTPKNNRKRIHQMAQEAVKKSGLNAEVLEKIQDELGIGSSSSPAEQNISTPYVFSMSAINQNYRYTFDNSIYTIALSFRIPPSQILLALPFRMRMNWRKEEKQFMKIEKVLGRFNCSGLEELLERASEIRIKATREGWKETQKLLMSLFPFLPKEEREPKLDFVPEFDCNELFILNRSVASLSNPVCTSGDFQTTDPFSHAKDNFTYIVKVLQLERLLHNNNVEVNALIIFCDNYFTEALHSLIRKNEQKIKILRYARDRGLPIVLIPSRLCDDPGLYEYTKQAEKCIDGYSYRREGLLIPSSSPLLKGRSPMTDKNNVSFLSGVFLGELGVISSGYAELNSVVIRILKKLSGQYSYTRVHSERVAQYSLLLAEELAQKKNGPFDWADFLLNAYLAGLLHDIGKVNIPKKIINGKAGLNEKELIKIKTHVSGSVRILKKYPIFPREVIDGVRFHHQRWNGQGYPYQLTGENIPLIASIVSVADVFDATTNRRPYHKKVLDPQATRKKIILGRGTQFNPKVVDSFEELCFENKIEPIMENEVSDYVRTIMSGIIEQKKIETASSPVDNYKKTLFQTFSLAMQGKDYPAALNCLKKILFRYPHDAEAMTAYLKVTREAGSLREDAFRDINEIIQAKQFSSAAYYIRSVLYYDKKDFANCLADLCRAVESADGVSSHVLQLLNKIIRLDMILEKEHKFYVAGISLVQEIEDTVRKFLTRKMSLKDWDVSIWEGISYIILANALLNSGRYAKAQEKLAIALSAENIAGIKASGLELSRYLSRGFNLRASISLFLAEESLIKAELGWVNGLIISNEDKSEIEKMLRQADENIAMAEASDRTYIDGINHLWIRDLRGKLQFIINNDYARILLTIPHKEGLRVLHQAIAAVLRKKGGRRFNLDEVNAVGISLNMKDVECLKSIEVIHTIQDYPRTYYYSGMKLFIVPLPK
ncbi:MAG: 50S ribosomal protein L11 methyltransferase [Candidatus Omnitrophica bacterium]|nr:50S ribosomal protein L11 methyltransferase [Candidatus Omnitrophota bacterium]